MGCNMKESIKLYGELDKADERRSGVSKAHCSSQSAETANGDIRYSLFRLAEGRNRSRKVSIIHYPLSIVPRASAVTPISILHDSIIHPLTKPTNLITHS